MSTGTSVPKPRVPGMDVSDSALLATLLSEAPIGFEALALVEARIDFSDEADVPEDLIGPALNAAQQLRETIVAALADGGRGERLRDGLVVAIAGPPNAGKSTLLNRLVGRKLAIVTPKVQTTRTRLLGIAVEGSTQVILVDTPGIFAPRRRLDLLRLGSSS